MWNDIPSVKFLEYVLRLRLGSRLNITTSINIFILLNGKWYIIPKDSTSDGASIPWILTFIIKRMSMKILLFSYLHDYMYRTQFTSRYEADSVYKEGLLKTSNWFIAYSFYYVLRCTGWIAWRSNRKKGLETYPEAMDDLANHIIKRGKENYERYLSQRVNST